MDLVFLDNRGKSVGSALEEAIPAATRVSIAVAYSTPDGLGGVEPGLQEVGERGGALRFLTGLDDFVTDIRGVERFTQIHGAECKVFLPMTSGDRTRFHPKLYLLEGERESSAIVGSANLTGAGLRSNHEAALWIRGEPRDPLLTAVGEAFGLLWNSPRAVQLSEQLAEQYRTARSARSGALAEVIELDEYRDFVASLRADLTRPLLRPEARKWLMITNRENLEICLELGRWGDQRYERIAQIQPGDGVIFYVTGEHTLGGLALTTSPARSSQERPWPDRPYPYQMDVDFLMAPAERPSIRPLVAELDLFGHSTANWGRRLQTTLRALSERDFSLLSSAINQAAVGGDVQELEREPWTEEELSAAVEAYDEMLGQELGGQPYVKAEVRRRYLEGPLSRRSHKSFEDRMGNISFVRQQLGLPAISGYKPRRHVGRNRFEQLRSIIESRL